MRAISEILDPPSTYDAKVNITEKISSVKETLVSISSMKNISFAKEDDGYDTNEILNAQQQRKLRSKPQHETSGKKWYQYSQNQEEDGDDSKDIDTYDGMDQSTVISDDNISTEEIDNIDYDPLSDPDVQKDAADHVVSFFVHIALIFFSFIFSLSVIGSIFLVSNFGVVGIGALVALLSLVCALGFGIWRILSCTPKLKPFKNKLTKWKAIAKAVVDKEIANIWIDLANKNLLTYEQNSDYQEHNANFDDINVERGTFVYTSPSSAEKNMNKKKGPRSFLIKYASIPIKNFKRFQKKHGGERGKWKGFSLKRKKNKIEKSLNQNETSSPQYVPPIV